MDPEPKRRQFRWGLLLAWSFPLVFLVTVVPLTLYQLSQKRTTGLGAVAGGISESLNNFGIVIAIVFQITAIVLLVRSWPGGQSPYRAMISLISMACAVLTLFICGAAVWSIVHRTLH
jgi:magnesium-transporting ATPase (P-type)